MQYTLPGQNKSRIPQNLFSSQLLHFEISSNNFKIWVFTNQRLSILDLFNSPKWKPVVRIYHSLIKEES